MLSRDLKPKDIFRVDSPDPESTVRACLTNDPVQGIRFGFPNNSRFWCYMGEACEVELVRRDGDDGDGQTGS